MPSIWDALAGVGIGLGTAGSAIAQERRHAAELARQQVRDELLQRRVGLEEKQYESGLMDMPVESIPTMFRRAGATGTERIPREVAALYSQIGMKETEKAEDKARAEALRQSIIGDAATADPTGVMDPGMLALANRIPYLTREGRDKIILEQHKIREPHTSVQRVEDPTGQYHIIYDRAGNEIRRQRVGEPKPTKETEGDRRAAEVHSYLQNVRKLMPGTPQYEKEFMDWRNRPLTIFPGGEGYKATDFLGGGPATTPPREGAPSPTVKVAPNPPAVGTEATANLADFRTLLGQLDKVGALYEKYASQYVGPVAGRLGAVRNVTGVGASEEEADFRAELASIQNSIIYLKSGKQINEQEYVRLRRELPEANDPAPVFKAKLARARGLVQTMLANREAEFKARGYRGGEPDNTTATPQTQPEAAPVQKWGRDAQGRPVRLK